MNSEEFRKCGYQMVDYVADYIDNIQQRQPLPNVKPGYLRKLIPTQPPEQPESFESIMMDLESCIQQGMTHWQHPNFHAYFPSGNSWPSVLGDVLSNATAVSCATWAACPVATELEMIILDWVAKFLDIPKFYYSTFSNPDSRGGGNIQSSASECVFVAMIAAREHAVAKLMKLYPNTDRAILKGKLTGYCSSQCHSSVEKAAIMCGVILRILDPDDRGILRAETLVEAIEIDLKDGLVPFFVCAILGSTSIGCFDDLMQIGPICRGYNIWLHADAAYAGSGFICPELQYIKRGLEYTWSFNINTNKWMLTNFDCSLFWVKYKHLLVGCLSGYNADIAKSLVEDFRFWGLQSTRRFRAIKLWCVIRNYGIRGIQRYLRNHCTLIQRFVNHLYRDKRFDVIGYPKLGLCCFAYRGKSEPANRLTQKLIEALNATRQLHLVPSSFQNKFVIRFSVNYEFSNEKHIDFAWDLISEHANIINHLYEKDTQLLEQEITAYEGVGFKLSLPRFSKFATTIIELLKPFRENMKRGSEDKLVSWTSLLDNARSFGSIMSINQSATDVVDELIDMAEDKLVAIEQELQKLTAKSSHIKN